VELLDFVIVCVFREMCTEFESVNLKEGEHLGDVGVFRTIILKWVLQKFVVRMWNGFV